jgi:hypothetical protein
VQKSKEYQYQKLITQNHPCCGPMSGLGFTGITLMIEYDRDPKHHRGRSVRPSDYIYFYAAFRVGRAQHNRDKTFAIKRFGYQAAWQRAVDCWAERYEIRDKDKARILANIPSPDRFKALRRYLNGKGMQIPVSVLTPVYEEQRDALRARRLAKIDLKTALEQERDAFYEKRQSKVIRG